MKSNVPQNILMVIPSLEMGGAQSNMLRLASEFDRIGHRVAIVDLKPSKRDSDYVDSLLAPSIPIFSPPFFVRNNRRNSLSFLEGRGKIQRGLLKIRRETVWLQHLIERMRIDAVHSHMYLADLYLSRQLDTEKRKSIIRLSKQCGCYNRVEERQTNEQKTSFKKKIQQIFSSIDGVVTMTARHDAFLHRHGLRPKTQRIYNGIPLPVDLTSSPTDFLRCVMCARDEPTKGWEAAIHGIIQAKKLGVKVRLDLIGSGPNINQLKNQFEGNGLIHFVGALANPMKVMSEYDIGLLPSTFSAESLPNTVVEYQAAGLATIATSIGEIPNLIRYDSLEAGFLILPASQEVMGAAIAQCLSEYAAKPQSLLDHKTAARSLRQRFNIRSTAQCYLDFTHALKSQ